MASVIELTTDEQRERDELLARGYRDVTDAPHGLHVGARVRHRGEQYFKAIIEGTGVVVAVMEKSPSSWVAAGWGKRDIELIVRTDRDRFDTGSFIGRWADYHTEVVEPS